MERLLILGLGLAGQPTAAGLVIAAKGLIRFPELQAQARGRRNNAKGPEIDEITEYFLIGSFVSWLFALASLAFMVVFTWGEDACRIRSARGRTQAWTG